MIRSLAIAIVALALVPASAEAAKMRLGGKSIAAPATTQAAGNGGAAAATKTSAADPARVPFPPASAVPTPAPTLLRLTAAQDDKVWCRSEIVVGGFCVLN